MNHGLPRPTIVTAGAGALTLASIAATAGFLIGRYPAIPLAIPVHFRRGQPDAFMLKSYGLVLVPVWTQLILALVIGSIALLLLHRAQALPGHHRARLLHSAEAIALLGLVWISFQFMTAYSLTELWRRFGGGMGVAYNAALLTSIVLSILIGGRAMLKLRRIGGRAADDHGMWRFRAIYFNPADPALFVPARYGPGLTLNFGRPVAIAIMLAILLVGLGGPFLLAFRLFRRW